MILVLLIILGVLIWSIQKEIDRSSRDSRLALGECPGCEAVIEPEWLVCPHCKEKLCESCAHCHRSKFISQRHCPYCGDSTAEVAA